MQLDLFATNGPLSPLASPRRAAVARAFVEALTRGGDVVAARREMKRLSPELFAACLERRAGK